MAASLDGLLDDIIDKSGILNTPSPRSTSSEYSILAYLSWENNLVELTYPSHTSQWTKRIDCGSHSQHRWGLYNNDSYEVIQLVVRHSSCLKALFMQPLCRNCEMRHVWRQPCKTPSNIFYILPLSSTEECSALLEPLILSRKGLSQEMANAYAFTLPKAVTYFKVINSSPQKRKQLHRLEQDIEESVRVSNRQIMRIKQENEIKNEEITWTRNFNFVMQSEKNMIQEERFLENAVTPDAKRVKSKRNMFDLHENATHHSDTMLANVKEINKNKDTENSSSSNASSDTKPAFYFAYLPILPVP